MPRRWFAFAAAAALLIAPLAAADAATGATGCAGEACVLVTVEGGASVTVSYADVEAGEVNAAYRFRARVGAPVTSVQLRGTSISSITQDDANVPVGSVKYVEISTGPGTLFAISGDDLADPSPFPDGTVPAVYINSSNSLGYVTPLRSDDQPNDEGVTANGGAVSVTIHTAGRLLKPTISIDHSTVDAGSPVGFSASFDSDPGTAIDYSWNFGDGATASGAASESHSFSAAGSYQAVLTARGADGSLGIAKSELITVGTPAPATDAPGPGSGVASTRAPTTGPTTSTGHSARATPRPTTAATEKPTAHASTTAAATATTRSSAPSTSTARPPSTPVPISTATLAPGAPEQGVPITGILISGSDESERGSASPESSTPSAAAARAGSRAALGWGSAAAAGTVVLLGAGVLIESGLFGSFIARLKRRIR